VTSIQIPLPEFVLLPETSADQLFECSPTAATFLQTAATDCLRLSTCGANTYSFDSASCEDRDPIAVGTVIRGDGVRIPGGTADFSSSDATESQLSACVAEALVSGYCLTVMQSYYRNFLGIAYEQGIVPTNPPVPIGTPAPTTAPLRDTNAPTASPIAATDAPSTVSPTVLTAAPSAIQTTPSPVVATVAPTDSPVATDIIIAKETSTPTLSPVAQTASGTSGDDDSNFNNTSKESSNETKEVEDSSASPVAIAFGVIGAFLIGLVAGACYFNLKQRRSSDTSDPKINRDDTNTDDTNNTDEEMGARNIKEVPDSSEKIVAAKESDILLESVTAWSVIPSNDMKQPMDVVSYHTHESDLKLVGTEKDELSDCDDPSGFYDYYEEDSSYHSSEYGLTTHLTESEATDFVDEKWDEYTDNNSLEKTKMDESNAINACPANSSKCASAGSLSSHDSSNPKSMTRSLSNTMTTRSCGQSQTSKQSVRSAPATIYKSKISWADVVEEVNRVQERVKQISGTSSTNSSLA
jgi:hypothetical protein